MLLVQEATQELAVARARELVDQLPLVPNLLVHADLTPPLAERTRVFLGFAPTGELRGIATAYLGFGRPALGVATIGEEWDEAVAREILTHVREGVGVPAIAIDDISRESAWASAFQVKERHEEIHYVLGPRAALPVTDELAVVRVPRSDLVRLDAFLRKHGATAWSAESFATGPYVWVLEGDEVVAAAGVHFDTPYVGQVANVLVRESSRRQGLGRAVTAAIARRLRAEGKIVSLFVKADNTAARQLYEKLGFKQVRRLAYLELG